MTVILKDLNGDISLLKALQDKGFSVNASCGGRGTCGRCKVIANGKEVSACSTYPVGNVSVELDDLSFESISAKTAAVDLGTTNVVALLDGKTIVKLPNSQRSFGADVVTRIEYCKKGNLNQLTTLIRDQIDKMICGAEKVLISGNTIMEYIYSGMDPVSLSVPPFSCDELFLNSSTLAPCISAYVGGDIVSGLYYCNALDADGLWLYVDIGTNGEVALGNKDGFVTCATAAGPAFENGMDGLYGSEVIDIIAQMLQNGTLDNRGRLKGDSVLSQKSIREIQLAKGAIRGGIETLLKVYNKTYKDITKMIIAGDFGSFLNIENAKIIGLLPDIENVDVVGNASLMGTQTALNCRDELLKVCAICKYEDLSSSALFSDEFISYLNF